MKILVMSLLRIGDIAMAAPALRSLRETQPEAEIHLLINQQCSQIAELLPYIDRFWIFDRDRIQKGLGEIEVPFFEPYERLSRLVDELGAQSFDVSINLTQNRLSGWMMSVIDAKEKVGLCFDDRGLASFGSQWFRYLNAQVENEGRDVFHFTDVFRFGLGLDELSREPSLIESHRGREEAESFLASIGSPQQILSVQALTSDVKKDWGLPRFRAALEQFAIRHPDASVAILAAPFEKEKLKPFVDELRAAGVNAHLAVLSFAGAFSLLKRSKSLLTGDTSIKHLAAAARTPVVELSLGSADPYRTGPFAHGSLMIQSKESCAPCVHSAPCHRASQFCAGRIPTDLVAMVVGESFARRTFQLDLLASEYKDDVTILRVELRGSGFWAAAQIGEPLSEANVARWVDLTCRKITLSLAREPRLDRSGTEILQLSNLLRRLYPSVSEIEWRHMFTDFERQVQSVEGRMNGFRAEIRSLHGGFEDPRKMRDFIRGLMNMREKMRTSALLSTVRASLDQVIEDDISPAFTRFRRIVDVISEIDRRTAVDLKIIRGLGNQMEIGIDPVVEKI